MGRYALQSNTIVEFAYNVEDKQWIPLKTRHDKTIGNDYFVANNI